MFKRITQQLNKVKAYINFMIDKLIRQITMSIIRFVDGLLTKSISRNERMITGDNNMPTTIGETSEHKSKIDYIVYSAIDYKSGAFNVCTAAMNYLLSELLSQEAQLSSNEILNEFQLNDGDKVHLVIMTTVGRIVQITISYGDETVWTVDGKDIKYPLFGVIENCI